MKDDVLVQPMDEEIECIGKNQTCDVVEFLKDKDVIRVKWIYKTKQDVYRNVKNHYEILVARSFIQ